MEARINEREGRRLVGIKDYMRYCGLGMNKTRDLGREIGARVEIGGRVLYDLKKTDDYFDKLTGSTKK